MAHPRLSLDIAHQFVQRDAQGLGQFLEVLQPGRAAAAILLPAAECGHGHARLLGQLLLGHAPRPAQALDALAERLTRHDRSPLASAECRVQSAELHTTNLTAPVTLAGAVTARLRELPYQGLDRVCRIAYRGGMGGNTTEKEDGLPGGTVCGVSLSGICGS